MRWTELGLVFLKNDIHQSDRIEEGFTFILNKVNGLMIREDKHYIFETLDRIRYETHENNLMLKQICNVINTHLANHQRENEDDFGRNVLANLISSSFELGRNRR